ncbi:MAG: hypothetical protein JW751_23325, partial [Polyangiaceae bacterium]|nr:hypothetical protein [Polyangiaceae bacterium]
MRSLPFPAARRPLAAAIALLVALLATASRTSAQDVERATRIYDCVFLVTPKPDLPGPDLVRFPVGLTEEELLEADTGGFGTSLDPDRLVDLIQGNIRPDSWGHEKNTIQFAQGTLRVTQTPEVLDEIATFLDELRRKQQHTIHLVGRVLSVRLDHFAAAHARTARAGTPGAILSPEDVKRLLDVSPGDGRLAVLGTFSLPASSGQLVHAGSARATRCILDLDVEIAEDATISHPFLDDVLT